ncbi:MAG: penicillin-binding protein 2 [Brachymonas sp.]|nr:penicillin-binding protein 2 [Brachymonas sp.]
MIGKWWGAWRNKKDNSREDRALQKSLRGVTSVRGVKQLSLGANPLLTSHTPVWRSRLLVAGLALGFVTLAARAAYVQVINNSFFIRQGEVRFTRTLDLPANRGRILDRNGLILASSIPAQAIWAFPEEVDAQADKARLAQMAKLLGMPLKDIEGKLKDEDKTFVYLKRQVDEDTARQIAALQIKGIYQLKEYRRQYPEGASIAHIVGFTDIESHGIEGIERVFDAQLAGKAGSRRVIRDRLGRVVESAGDGVAPVDGKDVHLSIDSKVQYFAWQRLRSAVLAQRAKGGSVVVLDAQTGEVLALANYPSYDPNDRKSLSGEQLRNRALTDVYEPASTIKPITVALGLEHKKITPQTTIATGPGKITIHGATIGDVRNYGDLTVAGVLQKSSNIGTVKIAQRLGSRDMWENMRLLGLGERPDLPFPGVAGGRLRPWKNWRPIEQATISYGYGVSSSLFQITRAYSTFANDGVLLPVKLVRTPDETVPADKGVQVYSSQVAKQMRDMLHRTTLSGGTAQQARTEGYSVGGKTGTARKQIGRRYSETKYRASFVGIAPIDRPRIVVGVMIDEPQNSIYGGAVAAPVFSEVVQQSLRLLGVPPDMSVQAGVVVDAEQESL